jgi:hypothetical protein
MGIIMTSWDCFDTLIARKFIHPFSIFHQVAKKIGDASFVDKRIEAGYNTHTYKEIYDKLKYDPQIELDTELENCYPIVSNINSVKDKDIIVSDMYLPKEFIRQMLTKCGLNKDIHIIVSLDGKHTGKVWQTIDSRYIEYHIGDNIHSDYSMPQKYKIKTKLYNDSKMSNNESIVFEYDKNLASWMRYIRLQSPYSNININPNFHRTKNLLWSDQTNYNLPILTLGAKELEKIHNIPITFNFRDCIYLKPLYDKITKKHTHSIQTSRVALKNIIQESFINNVISAFQKSIVVDLHGSGVSFSLFLNKHLCKEYTLINLVGGATHQVKEPNIISIFTTSLDNGLSFEKHNYAELGTITATEDGQPLILECEHDIEAIRSQREAILCGINSIEQFLPIKNNRDLGNRILSKLSGNYTSQYISYL